MKFAYSSLTLLFLSLIIISCNKEEKTYLVDSGIYRGAFYRISENFEDTVSGISIIAMYPENNTFLAKGDTVTGIPYDCKGSYEVLSLSEIKFTSNSVAEGEWADQNAVIKHTYSYTYDKKNFNFWIEIEPYVYKFEMVKY